MDNGDLGKLALFLAALLFSGFFSASEAAFLSLQRGKLAALAKSDPAKSSRISRFSARPEKLLATVLTGNNLTNTAAAALGTSLALSYVSAGTAVIVSTAGVTVVLLIFAEAIPKTVATRYSVGFASLVALPLRVVELVLLPPIWLLERLVRGITAVFGLPDTHIVSQDELKALIEIGAESGSVQQAQAAMLGQVFRIEDRRVNEAMTHRTQIVGVKLGTTLREFLELVRSSPHSRYPVYGRSLDEISGIVSVNDVMAGMTGDEIDLSADVTQFAKPASVLPETKRIGELFNELPTRGDKIYILIDERGGVAGLVSLSQLVAEVIETYDLDGPEEPDDFVTIDENTFRVLGNVPLEEVHYEIGIELPKGPYETIAGFVVDGLGHVPVAGETLTTTGAVFEVVAVEGLRVTQVKISKTVQVEEGLE